MYIYMFKISRNITVSLTSSILFLLFLKKTKIGMKFSCFDIHYLSNQKKTFATPSI